MDTWRTQNLLSSLMAGKPAELDALVAQEMYYYVMDLQIKLMDFQQSIVSIHLTMGALEEKLENLAVSVKEAEELRWKQESI